MASYRYDSMGWATRLPGGSPKGSAAPVNVRVLTRSRAVGSTRFRRGLSQFGASEGEKPLQVDLSVYFFTMPTDVTP